MNGLDRELLRRAIDCARREQIEQREHEIQAGGLAHLWGREERRRDEDGRWLRSPWSDAAETVATVRSRTRAGAPTLDVALREIYGDVVDAA